MADALVGWRFWFGDEDGFLRSVMFDTPWPEGRRFMATCTPNAWIPIGHDHTAPTKDCSCGIYAHHTREQTLHGGIPLATNRVSVIGQVSMWGRVVQHETGDRAQYAYPLSLTVMGGNFDCTRHVRRLRERYMVDTIQIALP